MRRGQKRHEILSAPAWRSAVKQKQVAGLSRAATITRGEDGSVSFVASTATADRYGDTIDQAGWDTAAYEKNPVLLWAHDYATPPVGKVGRLDKAANLTAKDVTFTSEDQHPFGAQVGRMVAGGFLNTVSVGFLPVEWEERYAEGGQFLGFHFKKMELLEISVVPVPANPQALVEGRAFAKSVAEWADHVGTDAPTIAREYRDTLASWLKSIEDQQARTQDEVDGAAFDEMLTLLRSIDARLTAIEKALPGGALVRAPVSSEAPSISGALKRLLSR